ncbi:MAG: UvrD-helicase domain-containing protein [Hungatella sp.]|jgi:DNA helicase-2/ATP-dependent DNA helicase PcrA|nr:UvrD-helicase domain-containing protein [Hungatella sp.]
MGNYDLLNPMQKEAVLCTEGPLLILAGAGSGKTRVLTYRIAHLIEEKQVNPWNIMAITFTNKAAGEMRERVDKQVEYGSDSIWVSTFHSTCVRILRRHIEFLGFETNFTIYDRDDQKTLLKQIYKAMNIDTRMFKERSVMGQISSAKDELISPEDFLGQSGGDYYQKKVGEIYQEYQNRLKKNNALDFDDLIVKTVELFRSQPQVLDYYQERFKYIMVDEYQDTNTAQFELVHLLASKYKNLCVVGDDDQSIYKFRGANIWNILHFEDSFPGAKVIKLEQNYRSTQNILDAANAVIRNNRGRKDKTLWTGNGAGDKIVFRQFDQSYEEAEFIVKDILAHGYPYEDCVVLYRTNAQSRLLEEKCISYSVPYRLVGGVNFYQRKEIKDILAYLKTIANGKDDLAADRIINVPKRGIGAASMAKVIVFASANGYSLYDAMTRARVIPGLGKTAEKIGKFTDMIEVFRRRITDEAYTIRQLIEDVLEETGYRKELEAEGDVEGQSRLDNIQELINKAVNYWENAEHPGLDEFLEEVALVADVDQLDQSEHRVTLMTLHSAKGLEFENVYLSGMEDGLFPSYMTITSDDSGDLEEERRLCYVGITRAKTHLTLTSARIRMVNGETRYCKTSRFIEEIPEEYLQSGRLEPRLSGGNARQRIEAMAQDASLPWNQQPKLQGVSRFGSKSDSYGTGIHKENAYASRTYQPAGGKAGFGKTFSVEKSKGLDYQAGDRVKHVKFGCGVVQEIKDGAKDYEVTVCFDTAGVKRMFASFAKLEKL